MNPERMAPFRSRIVQRITSITAGIMEVLIFAGGLVGLILAACIVL